MPVSFSSPPRNLFLLGSSGADVVTNFFKTIDQSAGNDDVYLPDEIRYTEYDEKFILAGTAQTPNSKEFGWFEKRNSAGTADWETRVESTTTTDTTLRALEIDSNGKLIVVGKTGTVPWIARYTSGGVIEWQTTTNSANVEYTGVAVDSNNQYYACGNTPVSGTAQAFVEKFDANGNPGWGKSAFMLGRDVVLNKVAANTRGEVVAVGYLEDDNAFKGYVSKIDTNTGEVLWDRTIQSFEPSTFGYEATFVESVYIDGNDQIYVVGRLFRSLSITRGFIIKYSAEGNIIWQKETPVDEYFEFLDIKSDTETQQTIVFGRYYNAAANDWSGVLSKYTRNGSLVWRRIVTSSYNGSNSFGDSFKVNLDADPTFYYLLFIDTDENPAGGTPISYTYGKVSSSGNGLGSFEYDEGTGETIFYDILSVNDRIGRLSDGSVRQDTSDLITYPFNANKILFDDLATQVANKKRQMDTADSFEYSGSPAIRIADFTELDLRDESFDVNVPANEVVYESAGTYTFTVPAGVTEVSAVVVGSGGGAASSPGANAQSGGGGGGGGLAYGTFTVTPGEDLTIVVGNFGVGGASGTTAGTAGESTTISRGATVLLEGGGGAGGQADAPTGNSTIGTIASGGSSSGTERDGGGSGGSGGPSRGNFGGGGGGGAGGYSGQGGPAGSGNSETGEGGTGGGGGGGGGQSAGGTQNNGGGGVGLFGGPIDGAGGANGNPGSGGSNGQGGQPGGKGGKFGGGGGGAEDDTNAPGADGGIGGARIIWGAGRSFPNNALQDFSSVETRVRDKSGKGNNGVVNGATLNAAGYWDFDGVDDRIVISRDDFTTGLNIGFSIETWFKFDTTPTLATSKGYVWDQTPSANGASFRIGLDGRLTTFAYPSGGGGVILTATPVDYGSAVTGKWYHAVTVVDTNSITLYVDGEYKAQATGTMTAVASPGNTDFFIGSNAEQDEFMDGQIGEFRIYPRVLTAAQIFQNYNATKSKYINEAPDTAPKITSNGIVVDSNLLLNYDFGNRATYDRAENLHAYSEDLSKWTVETGGSVISNTHISPDGNQTADTINGTANGSSAYRIVSLSNATTYTFSVFIKYLSGNENIRIEIGDAPFARSSTTFNTTTGVLVSNTGGTATVNDVVSYGNGWYRYSITRTTTSSGGGFMDINHVSATASSVAVWGAQVEHGSIAGRYIKTSGTAITAPTTVKNLSSNLATGIIDTDVTFNSGGWFEFPNTNANDTIYSTSSFLTTSPGLGSSTIELWIKDSTNPTTHKGPFWVSDNFGNWIMLDIRSDYNSFQISTETKANNRQASTNQSQLVDTNWHHIAITRSTASGGGVNAWIDNSGVSFVPNDGYGSWPASTNVLVVGGFSNGGINSYQAYTSWEGKIGEFRIYNRVLTPTEITQNYNATRAKYGV